tara:strand:- start:12413 stop:12655 length:243 start_codon:yes stop_codon:yes gene_type:complete
MGRAIEMENAIDALKMELKQMKLNQNKRLQLLEDAVGQLSKELVGTTKTHHVDLTHELKKETTAKPKTKRKKTTTPVATS